MPRVVTLPAWVFALRECWFLVLCCIPAAKTTQHAARQCAATQRVRTCEQALLEAAESENESAQCVGRTECT